MGRPGTLRGSAQAELGGTPRDGTLVVHAFVDLTNAAPQRTKTAAVNTAVTFARATAVQQHRRASARARDNEWGRARSRPPNGRQRKGGPPGEYGPPWTVTLRLPWGKKRSWVRAAEKAYPRKAFNNLTIAGVFL